jgi:hypothetical protein
MSYGENGGHGDRQRLVRLFYDAYNTWRGLVNGDAIMPAINIYSIELIDGIFGRNINGVQGFSGWGGIIISITHPLTILYLVKYFMTGFDKMPCASGKRSKALVPASFQDGDLVVTLPRHSQ